MPKLSGSLLQKMSALLLCIIKLQEFHYTARLAAYFLSLVHAKLRWILS